MVDYEFAIPVKHEELLESHIGQYHVEDIVQQRYLQAKLQESLRTFNHEGVEFVLQHFDTYFSILVHGTKMDWPLINKGFEHIDKACKEIGGYLEPILQEKEIEVDTRNKALNCTKMLLFLFTSLMKVKDSKLAADNSTKLTLGKKGRKNIAQADELSEWSDDEKHSSLVTIFNVIQLPLNKLWDPPLAEQNFVEMIARPCYKMMEDPTIKTKNLRETVFQILGTLNKKYNHGMSCTIKIVQVLQYYEHSVSPICAGISQMSEEFGLTTLGPQLAREIAEALSNEEGSGATEGPSTRNCGQFLVELTREQPKQMAAAIHSLQSCLDSDECYFLRVSVLGMMCEILCTELKGEELTEEQRAMRDDFLEDLEEHILDLSAHVRSKVLQFWCRMQRDQCVPVVRQKTVLQKTAGRLKDKAVLVRKAAMQLLKIFLEFNPFSAQLKLDLLESQLMEERKHLDDVRAQINPGPDPALLKKWDKMEKRITEAIQTNLDQCTQDDPPLSQSSLNDIYASIRECLSQKDYYKAFMIARHAERDHPEAKLLRCEMDKKDQVAYFIAVLRNVFVTPNPRDSIQHCENDQALYKRLEEKEQIVGFLEESVEFSRTMSEAVPIIHCLLMSKQAGDVSEAIEFFTTAHQFNIESAKQGVTAMLLLVWSPDQEKRAAVEKAYREMYLATEIRPERTRAYTIAKNLIKLLQTTDRGTALALEHLLFKWTESGDISPAVIQVLWEMFSKKLEGSTEMESHTALNLLVMISKAKPSVTTANIDAIQSIGFSGNYYTLSTSMQLLLPLGKMKNRYPMDYPLLKCLYEKLVTSFMAVNKFVSFASGAIEVIYAICETPDKMCIKLLAELWNKIFEGTDKGCGDESASYPVEYLTRFIFLLGHIAVQQLIYLDVTVYAELRRRNEVREQRKLAEKEAGKNRKKDKNGRKSVVANFLNKADARALDNSSSSVLSASARIRNQSLLQTTKGADITTSSVNDEDCAGLEGAVADDADAEFIRNVCENHIVSADTSLAKYTSLIKTILMNPSKHTDENLQAAAALTLGRFMLVSSVCCEDHMQLLMTVLKRSSNKSIRNNIIITLTDLTLRFPNIIQPWTQHIYERLHDESVIVRQCTVKMLSYLVLHEMIRVKGQISDMALCCVDPDDNVCTMTKLFFKQLSQKGNSLYNVMPDIISRLSDTQLNVPEDNFRTILKYIMSLIQKDRQMEALVEKLCHRFKLSTEERQWRDIAYCLSLFNYNERSIRKLIENIDCYKDKLYCKSVYESFKTIMANASKLAKADLKAVVAELSDKIEDCFNLNEDDQGEQGSPANRPRPRLSRHGKSTAKRKPRRRQRSDPSSGSESEEETRTPAKGRQPTTPGVNPSASSMRASARKKTSRVIYQSKDDDSSDDDMAGFKPIEEEEEEEEVFKKPAQKRAGRKKK